MTDKQELKREIERLDSLALEYAMCPINTALEDELAKGITKILQAHFEYIEYGIDSGNLLVEINFRSDSNNNVWDYSIINIIFSNCGEDEIELLRDQIDFIEREVQKAIDEANADNYRIAKTDV